MTIGLWLECSSSQRLSTVKELQDDFKRHLQTDSTLYYLYLSSIEYIIASFATFILLSRAAIGRTPDYAR